MLKRKLLKIISFKKLLLVAAIFALGAGFGHWYLGKINFPQKLVQEEKNTPKAFLSETYDKIKENYWETLTDEQLTSMFKNASSALGNPLSSEILTKDELIKKLDKEKAVKLVAHVLANLQPIGRSGLFGQKQEQELKNTVSNINPDKDLYKDLGLSKGASEEVVTQAYEKKEEELKKEQTPQAQEQLKQIAYAKEVLTKKESKQRYDAGGVEPTIFTKVIGPVLYLQFTKFSPTSLEEFQQAFDAHKDNAALDSLIFDLRGNVGGAIDATALFLGFFLGKNQLAFEFYKKGDFLPFRTPTEKLPTLPKYKQIVVLIDGSTQSSAEMMAATFKKYHLGVVLGDKTKGWGTVERIFPLDNQIDPKEKYSMFLVHSITLRDDNQPIEGRGVEPDINIQDSNWQQQLFSYFRNQDIINAVKSLI